MSNFHRDLLIRIDHEKRAVERERERRLLSPSKYRPLQVDSSFFSDSMSMYSSRPMSASYSSDLRSTHHHHRLSGGFPRPAGSALHLFSQAGVRDTGSFVRFPAGLAVPKTKPFSPISAQHRAESDALRNTSADGSPRRLRTSGGRRAADLTSVEAAKLRASVAERSRHISEDTRGKSLLYIQSNMGPEYLSPRHHFVPLREIKHKNLPYSTHY